MDAFIVISSKSDTNYFGVGSTITSTAGSFQTLFTSTTNPSVIRSIRLINYDLSIDEDASVAIYRGEVRLGYLAYNMTVPKNSTIEIIQKPKYLVAGDSLRATAATSGGVSVCISGKYIV